MIGAAESRTTPPDDDINSRKEPAEDAEVSAREPAEETVAPAPKRERSEKAPGSSPVNAQGTTPRTSVAQKTPEASSGDPASTVGASPRFSLTPGGYVQTRLAHESRAYSRADENYEEVGLPSDSSTTLTLPRAAAFVEGSAYVPALTYRLQIGFDPNFSLEDAYVNYAFADSLQIRIGRDKRPFSRQYLNRRRFLQWTDISRAERYFGPSRDVGVLLHNDYLHTVGFEYALGVYRGQFDHFQYIESLSGDIPRIHLTQSDETDAQVEPTVVFRVGYKSGPGAYSESAWGEDDVVFGVALSGLLDLNTNGSGSSRAQVELDGIFKAGGFSLSYMLGLQLRQTGDDFLKNRDQGGASASVQAGYVIGQRVEPVLRLSAATMGEGMSTEDTVPFLEREAAAGVNVYFFGHDLKWTNEVSLASWHESRGQPEDLQVRHMEARSQLQFGF